MKFMQIPKILAISFIILGLVDFIFFVFTFNPNFEVYGFFILLFGIPIGISTLSLSIFIAYKTTNNPLKKTLKTGCYLIIGGFFIGVILIFAHSKISKYSRLVIKNESNSIIENIQLTALTQPACEKSIKKIDCRKAKTVFLNKYENHKWELSYYSNKLHKRDTITYYRIFNSATNDTIIITPSKLIAKMYELR